MSDTTPSQAAHSEPRPDQQTSSAIATDSKAGDSSSTAPAGDKSGATYTEMASNAAGAATAAAVNVKDNVFSMFGGGAKKEPRKEEDEAPGEKSGSSKAQKAAEGEEGGGDVSS